MTNLKILNIALVSLAVALAAGAASAQVQFNVPANLPIAKSTLTRAEVIADLLIWRASGLYDLHNQGPTSDYTNRLEYAQASALATAKYSYMRASPQFAVLIDQINRGETPRVLVALR